MLDLRRKSGSNQSALNLLLNSTARPLFDNQTDIYALGTILFELLSGSPPFAETPYSATRPLPSIIPSLHALAPDLPEALDLVVGKALEPDPVNRYAHANDLVVAFQRVLNIVQKTPAPNPNFSQGQQTGPAIQATLPPTVNWFDGDDLSAGKQQAQTANVTREQPLKNTDPVQTASTNSNKPVVAPSYPQQQPDEVAGVDPFNWWTTTGQAQTVRPAAGTLGPRRTNPKSGGTRRFNRRTVIASLVAGAVTLGVVAVVEGKNLFHTGTTASNGQMVAGTGSSATTANGTASKSTTGNMGNKKETSIKPGKTSGAGNTTQPTPTQAQAAPKPTPPPAHTGTVVGSASMAKNSAVNFTNPATGNSSILVRLANGNFVASSRYCPHRGLYQIYYDPGTQMLVCNAHGAVFNPQNGFAHVSGPGSGSLTPVTIRVNGDGTITTG